MNVSPTKGVFLVASEAVHRFDRSSVNYSKNGARTVEGRKTRIYKCINRHSQRLKRSYYERANKRRCFVCGRCRGFGVAVALVDETAADETVRASNAEAVSGRMTGKVEGSNDVIPASEAD